MTTTPAAAQFDTPEVSAEDQAPCSPPVDQGDPLTATAWATDFIGIDEAHQYNRGTFEDGDPVTIAVIDSGVQADLEIFGDRVLDGFDPWDPDARGKCDGYFHGTGVAAIAAGGADGDQFIGVAPEANILPLRAFQGDEGGDIARSQMVASLINDAVANDADVINVSIALPHTPELEAAVNNAITSNVVIVAATGNENLNMDDTSLTGEDAQFFPANYPDVIAVGANNPSGNFYQETNYGNNMDLLAPGQEVTFPYAGGDWRNDSGTSYAAPYVAGAAALLKGEYGESVTPQQIEQRLRDTAIPPPNDFNIYQGYGVLNVGRALADPIDEESAGEASESPSPTDFQTGEELIEAIPVGYDPLATEKAIAWASVGVAAALITLVLVLRKIIPKGRGRGWRPGTRKSDDLPVKVEADPT
ncbi:S8 family peptidase [Glycomyces tenuis]|uniref:S8 family peptidase n=1 Tax=Glycomyces tenuis TaxID=58116 RepID=UPI0003F7F6EA|nr:S8 family serine peptidase [Glycomyces tenuis]